MASTSNLIKHPFVVPPTIIGQIIIANCQTALCWQIEIHVEGNGYLSREVSFGWVPTSKYVEPHRGFN